jgi:hypothetical protein
VFQRTGVRVFLILLVLAGIITGVVIGINVRNANRKREEAQQDVKEFQVRVEAALTAKAIGQVQAGSVLILSELGATISELQSGQINKGQLKATREKLQTWQADTKEAAEKVVALDTGTSEYAKDLAESRTLIQQSLLMYAALAKSVDVALDLEGKPKDALVQGILEQYPTAATVFDTGWRGLQSIRSELEIPEVVQNPTLPPGIPGGVPGGVPPGIPGVPPAIPSP